MTYTDHEIIQENDTHRVILVQDTDPTNPRRDCDQLGVLWAPHRRYALSDECHEVDVLDRLIEDRHVPLPVLRRFIRIHFGATVVLPVGMIDHSGLSMYVGGGAHPADPGGWDSGTVGVIFDTAASRELNGTPPEHVEECLRGEIEEFDKYLTGDVWGVVTQRKVTWTSDTGLTRTEWEDEWEQSCWGFIGYEYAVEAAKGEYALA